MRKIYSISFFVFLFLSTQLYARGGFFGEFSLGIDGKIKGETATLNDVADNSLVISDRTNAAGFKFQAGYKHEWLEKISAIGMVGYQSRNSKKATNLTIKTEIFDLSFAAQYSPTEHIFIRAGTNFPAVGKLIKENDNQSQEDITGGEFSTTGKFGVDVIAGYSFMKDLFLNFGFTITRFSASKKFSGYYHPTAGTSYTIKYGNVRIYQYVVGLKYIF